MSEVGDAQDAICLAVRLDDEPTTLEVGCLENGRGKERKTLLMHRLYQEDKVAAESGDRASMLERNMKVHF